MIIKTAPIFKQLIPMDCMINVANLDKVIFRIPSEEVHVESNGTIPKGTALDKVLHGVDKVAMVVPKEVFGVSFKATAVPLKDDQGNIIGGVSLGVSLKNQDVLIQVAQGIAAASQEISATIQSLAGDSNKLEKLSEVIQ